MNRQWLASLADFLIESNIEHVVASPGSRNAPLLLHLGNHPRLKLYSHVDERSAAFLALGMAQKLRSPVALVCTSGSALLNFGPALSEAFYQQIPLLVLSADRPAEWLDQSDGQTIRQNNVFQSFVRKSFTLPIEVNHRDDEWFIWRSLSEAVLATQYPIAGPVHVNMPFREPLYNKEINSGTIPTLIRTLPSHRSLDESAWKDLIPGLKQYKRIMILAGLGSPDIQTRDLLASFAEFSQVVVLSDIASNQYHPLVIRAADDIIAHVQSDSVENFVPELLITFGGPIISKRLKVWLRKMPPLQHWHINASYEAPDTFQCLTRIIASDVNPFLKQLLTHLPKLKTTYAKTWQFLNEDASKHRDSFLKKLEFSDFKVCYEINERIPHNSIVHLANSMPVRYAHFLDWKQDIQVYSNRGVSGIDGCLSTAVGSAMHFDGFTTVITGDLAMFYDSHALWNSQLPEKLRIIVLNNGGGGIFRIIDGPGKFADYRNFFETPHQLTAEGIAKMHQIPYFAAHNSVEMNKVLDGFYGDQKSPQLLEIFTNQEINAKTYSSYFEYINSKLS